MAAHIIGTTEEVTGRLIGGPVIDGDGVGSLVSPIMWFYVEGDGKEPLLCASDSIGLFAAFAGQTGATVCLCGTWFRDVIGPVLLVSDFELLPPEDSEEVPGEG